MDSINEKKNYIASQYVIASINIRWRDLNSSSNLICICNPRYFIRTFLLPYIRRFKHKYLKYLKIYLKIPEFIFFFNQMFSSSWTLQSM